MRYIINKNYTEFIKEVIGEKYNKEKITEEEIKNCKNELRKILKALGMIDILDDERYKKNNKKLFPIHFQVLCKTLLMQNRSTKDDFVYKIKNKKWDDIKESEIEEFTKKMAIELLCWFTDLEYQSETECERDKEALDEIFLEIEEQMLEDCTTEYIDELKEGKAYTSRELEYLKTKFWIRQQCNVFVDSMKSNLIYRCRIRRAMKDIHEEIDSCVNQILDLKSVEENLILLHDYESSIIGTVPLPQIHVNNAHNKVQDEQEQKYQLNNMQKSFLIDELHNDILQSLDIFEKCTKGFIDKKNNMVVCDDKKCIKEIRNEIN